MDERKNWRKESEVRCERTWRRREVQRIDKKKRKKERWKRREGREEGEQQAGDCNVE